MNLDVEDSFYLDIIQVGFLQTNCYIFGDSQSREVVVIDPGADGDQILDRLTTKGLQLQAILLTHEHPDHTGGIKQIKKRIQVPVVASYLVRSFGKGIDRPIHTGDHIQVGRWLLDGLESPGHSAGGLIWVCYAARIAFVGDTIFAGGIGRTDFGGNYSRLMGSISVNLMHNPRMDDNFQLFPGHGPNTTVGIERQTNPFRQDFG